MLFSVVGKVYAQYQWSVHLHLSDLPALFILSYIFKSLKPLLWTLHLTPLELDCI